MVVMIFRHLGIYMVIIKVQPCNRTIVHFLAIPEKTQREEFEEMSYNAFQINPVRSAIFKA